jgi:hypothetical protein
VAPLSHIGALVASATPVIKDFDNPSEILQLIDREKINFMSAVPVMRFFFGKLEPVGGDWGRSSSERSRPFSATNFEPMISIRDKILRAGFKNS